MSAVQGSFPGCMNIETDQRVWLSLRQAGRRLFGLVLLLAWGNTPNPLAAAPVVVNSSNALASAAAPAWVIQQASQLRWFFAHASVGGNMMSGIDALHLTNASQYFFSSIDSGSNPPALTQPGVFYSFDRGNPGWQIKMDWFKAYVSNGWCYPKVDVLMNKLCFVDYAADPDYYLTNMAAVEQTKPQNWVVYMTMPLTTNQDYDNMNRNLFNERVRSWSRANNRILYDIADIESWDTNGVQQTFVYTNHVFQKEAASFSVDGEHLNLLGMQKAAQGLYTLSTALYIADRDGDGMPDWWEMANGLNPLDPTDASADPDGDGMSNLKEYLSGTDPQNAQSVLKLNVDSIVNGTCQLDFIGASNVVHTVQYNDAGPATAAWQTLATIDSQPNERDIVIVDSLHPTNAARYYRVAATRAP